MKRSKIFLGLTTAVLAVVGVAAAKKHTNTTRFYVTTGGTWCTSKTSICVKTTAPANQCFFTFDPGGGQAGTQYSLYTKGPVGSFPSGSACTNALLYTTTGQ